MTAEIQQNDTTEFEYQVLDQDGNPVNMALAWTKIFRFQRPDGSFFEVNAGFVSDGTDGWVSYTCLPTDLSQTGQWKYQIAYTVGPLEYSTNVNKFKVYQNIPIV